MEKRKCPYCGEDLDKRTAMYALIWSKDEDELQEATGLKNYLETCKEISDRRKEERFRKLWKRYGWELADMKFSASEYILSVEEIRDLITFIEQPESVRFVNRAETEFTSLLSAPAATDLELGFPRRARVEEKKEKSENYFYQRKNIGEEFDYQGDVCVGVKSHIVAKVRRVCHYCFNLIPDDVYELPMIKVYIMATPSSGKSSMLYSMYLNQENFLEKNQYKMKWSYIQDMTIDKYFKKFYESAQKYKEQKNTIVTPVKLISPFLIKVEYKKDEEETISLVIALYDNGGEMFSETNQDSETNQEQNVQSLNERVKGMDALVCILDGDNSKLNKNKYSVNLTQNDLDLIRENGKIFSSALQEEIEDNSTMEEMTLEDIIESYGIRMANTAERKAEDLRNHGDAWRDSSQMIIRNLEHRMGDQNTMAEIVRNQYFALVITKIDLLANSQMIPVRDRGLFFDRGTIDYFSEEERQRKLERDRKMREWKRNGILLEYNLKNFREANYHFVAAHMDNRRGIQPIRIEEPLVGIVEDFVRRKG